MSNFNPSTWDTEASRSLNYGTARATQRNSVLRKKGGSRAECGGLGGAHSEEEVECSVGLAQCCLLYKHKDLSLNRQNPYKAGHGKG